MVLLLSRGGSSSSSSKASNNSIPKKTHHRLSSNDNNDKNDDWNNEEEDDDENCLSRPKNSSSIRWSVAALLASALLNLLGFTMAGPITPALGKHFGLEVGASFGSLTSAYPLGMLFGLNIWPSLSDKIGRKPVICLSLFATGLGLAAQSLVVVASSSSSSPLSFLKWFLLTRVLTGSFAGSSPVTKAYLADVGASVGKLPRYLAMRDAASTMAFIVGPALGGIVYGAAASSLGVVIGISAAASILASLLVAVGVVEDTGNNNTTLQEQRQKLTSLLSKKTKSFSTALKQRNVDNNKTVNNDDNNKENNKIIQADNKDNNKKEKHVDNNYKDNLISCPLGIELWAGVATVCVISFLFNVADSTFHAFFSAFLRNGMGYSVRNIGMAFTLFACTSFAVSATVAGPAIRHFGSIPTCVAGLVAVGTGLGTLAAAASSSLSLPSWLPIGAAALYFCGVPLYGPTIPNMLLQCVPPHKRGAVMGLDGAINTVGRILSPLIMGELYKRRGPSVAFGMAGGAALLAALVAAIKRLLVCLQQQQTKINTTITTSLQAKKQV